MRKRQERHVVIPGTEGKERFRRVSYQYLPYIWLPEMAGVFLTQ
jgi:hypothetical protein